jgi:hypothetical protein
MTKDDLSLAEYSMDVGEISQLIFGLLAVILAIIGLLLKCFSGRC